VHADQSAFDSFHKLSPLMLLVGQITVR
jgi:hypothetical protein